ncbi:uncharacterized protein HKW66_Vig0009430 [Vigna angularis]|uniref:Uncharacterized protein n=1 Tax=Phaseolus angularis TaxID=3914 RepID=A0A8T0LHC2_PHAAN|nr:uncharacterized protein HKW66_Vig0009430 [Vigna angularis]
MENERTCEFRFWCVNGEDEDMWVALGLISRRFARLELREVEEDVRNLQRQHLGCGRILVFCRSVCGFLVIDVHHKHHLNLVVLRHRCRKLNSTLCCFSSSFSEKHHANSPNSDDIVELPFFPFPLVLFPGAILPL